MQVQIQTSCIRCGKTRIAGKVWVEKTDRGNTIKHTENVCPDKECQAIVDADFAAKREKKLQMTSGKK